MQHDSACQCVYGLNAFPWETPKFDPYISESPKLIDGKFVCVIDYVGNISRSVPKTIGHPLVGGAPLYLRFRISTRKNHNAAYCTV